MNIHLGKERERDVGAKSGHSPWRAKLFFYMKQYSIREGNVVLIITFLLCTGIIFSYLDKEEKNIIKCLENFREVSENIAPQ